MRKILDIPDKIDTERFFKFVTTDKCWNWNGSLTAGGYGKFYNSGKLYLAHRVSFKIKNVIKKWSLNALSVHLIRLLFQSRLYHLHTYTYDKPF